MESGRPACGVLTDFRDAKKSERSARGLLNGFTSAVMSLSACFFSDKCILLSSLRALTHINIGYLLTKEQTMTTRHLVDPELVAMLDTFPALTLTAETLPLIRASSKEMFAQAPAPDFPAISVSERYVPGPEGAPEVRVLVYQPTTASTPLPALLWIHGGGYVLGTADQDDLSVKSIVSAVGCAAVSVDYRLAPETPHPGPVEDCYAALKWLHTHAGELGMDPTRIAIGGASAGGGLTAALALLTRDRGEVPLVFQLLIFPMLDDRTVTAADPHPYTGEFIWTPEANRFG